MAKDLIFKLGNKDYAAAPVKLERKKIYGWTDTVATDRDGEECVSAYLFPDDSLIIPKGGIKLGTVDSKGRWVDKSELTAYGGDGKEVLPVVPSSFDSIIELRKKASVEEFLDNDWDSVYQLNNEELKEAIGESIYKFDFSYRGGTNQNDGYLIAAPAGLFLFSGNKQEFKMVGFAQESAIDEPDEDDVEESEEIDFSMF